MESARLLPWLRKLVAERREETKVSRESNQLVPSLPEQRGC